MNQLKSTPIILASAVSIYNSSKILGAGTGVNAEQTRKVFIIFCMNASLANTMRPKHKAVEVHKIFSLILTFDLNVLFNIDIRYSTRKEWTYYEP